MPQKIKYIRRSDTVSPTDDTVFRCQGSNYKVPMCGCSNYVNPITVGNIVGVVMKSYDKTMVEFTGHSHLLLDKNNRTNSTNEMLKIDGTTQLVEEHLFKITKVLTQSKFKAHQVFLDSDKIIRKYVSEDFDKLLNVPVDDVNIIEHICESKGVDVTFNEYNARRFVQSLEDGTISDKTVVPIKCYTDMLFDLSYISTERKCSVAEFYQKVSEHMQIIIDTFGQSVYDAMGNIELVTKHMNDTIDQFKINNPVVPINVTFSCRQYAVLALPTISHNLIELSYVNIFRVYSCNNDFKFVKTNHVTNWSGILLSDDVKSHVQVGNVLRMSMKDKQWEYLPYFRTILQISPMEFLATVENHYTCEYEDIIVLLNTNAITEIPTTWEGNENFASYDKVIGEGFGTTGHGALSNDVTQTYCTMTEVSDIVDVKK
jgi:hypothetical protein